MKRRRSPALRIITVVLLITVGIFFLLGNLEDRPVSNTASLTGENSAEEDTLIQKIQEAVSGEPQEVKELRKQQTADADEGHLEYYFGLLNENEQKAYREILEGIRGFHDKFYLSVSGDEETDRIYHAVLKDHPELFWVHKREKV